MVAIIDYGVGNLFSLCSSFKKIGIDAVVTNDIELIKKADKIILPGVGAFSDAILKLKNSNMDKQLIDLAKSGKNIMGICLGMQLLFEKSFEYGEHTGLGLLKGSVIPLDSKIPESYKIPHIGWNKLDIKKENKLLKYVKENDYVYFVHSYYVTDCDDVIATSEYGTDVTAIVGKGNVLGCQFHPEKSGDVGLSILRAFCEEDF